MLKHNIRKILEKFLYIYIYVDNSKLAGCRNFLAWLIFKAFLAMVVTKNGAGWQDAQATFYGDMAGRETIAGACGYSSHWLLVLVYNVGGGGAW